MKKIGLLLLTILFSSTIIKAQNEDFEKKILIYKGDTLHYRILYPKNYNKKQKYPLVLFLHGAGERGNDNEKQLIHGASLFTNKENRKSYPAIVLFPQCPKNDAWADAIRTYETGLTFAANPPITKPLHLVEKLLKKVQQDESVDKRRIYILGISMGGMGTFDMIYRHPKKFAAAIPICGGVDQARLKKVRKMPIRIYHGAADDIVSPDFSRNAYIELKAEGAKRVEYKEYTAVEHNSWDSAFAEKDFLSWLFSQKR